MRERPHGSEGIEKFLVHTGQHCDRRLSELFFEQLGIPAPDANLGVGSGSHAEQTAEIMKRFEPVCRRQQPTHVQSQLARLTAAPRKAPPLWDGKTVERIVDVLLNNSSGG